MSGRSVNLTTLFLGRLGPSKYFVHILSPVTDNCPSTHMLDTGSEIGGGGGGGGGGARLRIFGGRHTTS